MSYLHLAPGRIKILDQAAFARLCNDLMSAEFSKLSIPQRELEATDAVTAADGGIDCYTRCPDDLRDDWLPPGRAGWQYKSGACPSAKEIADVELVKPAVLEVIRRGDTYCLLTADDITGTKAARITEAINTAYAAHGHQGKGRVYAGKKLTRWVSTHLGLASSHFGIAVDGWQPFDQWEAARRFANAYFADASVAETIDLIRAAVEGRSTRCLYLVGRAGAGKTRGVMEALREDGLRQRVLYLADAASFNPNFFWQIRQAPESATILVVDECTAEHHARVRDAADSLPASCIVIAVGPLEGSRGPTGALFMGPLAIDQLVEILRSFHPGVPEHVLRAVAERCGGSPKLVVDLAQAAGTDPGAATWQELEQSPDVVGYLNRRVFPIDDLEPRGRVMRAISLFTRIGWHDDVANEGVSATAFLGVDWDTARAAVNDLLARGVVSRRGRYLYATPDVLANYLTRGTLTSRTPEELSAFFRSLSPGAQAAFAARLRQLGDEASTRDAVLQILGDGSFFLSLSDLADEGKARLLRLLVPAFPKLTVERLQRILEQAPIEELRLFTTGRREVIWALEEVAWWPEHFLPAASALLRLAVSENERIVNNASGVWTHFFQVLLAGTATPYHSRIPALHEALYSPTPEARRLGVLGISASLQTDRLHGTPPPADTDRLPPTEWEPATYDEWSDIMRDRFRELVTLYDDSDEGVRLEVVGVLHKRASDLVHAGLFEELRPVLNRLSSQPFEVRKKFMDVLSWLIKHQDSGEGDGAGTSRADLQAAHDLLAGSSFGDRLRLALSPWQIKGLPEKEISVLASEVLAQPALLEPEFQWLFSGAANLGFNFGHTLGAIDHDEGLLASLLSNWRDTYRDDRVISGYLSGRRTVAGEEWLLAVLSDWARDPSRVINVANAIWRLVSNEQSALILQGLLETHQLPAVFLRNLTAGFWTKDISAQRVVGLIHAVAADTSEESISGQLELIEQYLRHYPDRLQDLRADAMRLLEAASGLETRSLDSYHWGELAELLVEQEPVEIARLCIKALIGPTRPRLRIKDEFHAVLSNAIRIGGWPVFEHVIGPAFDQHPGLFYRLGGPFSKQDFLTQFAVADLMSWINDDVSNRLSFVAHSLPVGGPLSPHVRELLARWGDRREVRTALAATFSSGTFWGPESRWLKERLEEARTWTNDADANVREFSRVLIDSLEHRLERATVLEEEERSEQ